MWLDVVDDVTRAGYVGKMTDLEFNTEGEVAILSLNRPEKLNALRTQSFVELRSVVQEIQRDDSIKVVVLTGNGGSFCSGADIAEYSQMKSSREFFNFQANGQKSYHSLATLNKPVVGAVNGYALGGGFELALCCDVIFAGHKTMFGFPEVKLGLIPGGGTTIKLPAIIGAFRAKELIMSGRFMSASEAHKIGIVSDVVSERYLMQKAMKYANTLSALSGSALASVKKLVYLVSEQAISTYFEAELSEITSLYGSGMVRKKIDSFIMKQKRTE